ncbi:MAG TPA: PilZ domain-containing protein [Deltaproteobacteria bacterium]|nr:PilZ domain-containing protein [Deltaproteobacteria bacterium]
MNQHPRVWITQQDAKDLGLKGDEFPCTILDIKTLIYEILKTGSPRDIIVLPFFRTFAEVVEHIRDRGIKGPIIIYTNAEIVPMNLLDYAAQGVIFLDSSRFTQPMVVGFITFLQKQQEMSSVTDQPEKTPARAHPKPSQDSKEIRSLFKKMLRRRSKMLLTCQFKDNLPTLTVTCDIIQMVGEIETKLVLDNFNPEEFIVLYNQLGKDKSLSGFITQGDETFGFDLEVNSARMGKITVFLPEAVYEQKRKFFRVEPDPKDPVTLHIHPEGERTISVTARDVSEGGVGMITEYQDLEKGTTYPVALVLPKNQVILGNARVMFKVPADGKGFNYGMELDLHPADLQYLQHYVYKRQAGILAAIRNLTI